MTEPMAVGELLPGVLQEVIDRAGPDSDPWMEQVAATGYCAHPVWLHGTVEHADPATGEVRTVYSTGSPTPPCSRPAATAECRSVSPARRPTRPTASSSWLLAYEAAKVFPRP